MKAVLQLKPECKAKLTVRPGLKVTALMKQSIEILQMPCFELNNLLSREISNNPLLEEVRPASSSDEFFNQDGFDNIEQGQVFSKELQKKRNFLEGLLTKPEMLEEHLLRQLRILGLSESEERIGELIIGSINDSGFLCFSLDEIAQFANADRGKVEKVLVLVQRFDPAGVAARDIKECLLLQLKMKGEGDSLAAMIVSEHFYDLEMKRHDKIAKSLQTTAERVKDAREQIARLEPRPGRNFGPYNAPAIIPDIILQKVGDEYRIETNKEEVLWLRVNPDYKILLKNNQVLDSTKKYLREKLGSALWLIRTLEKRQRTIIRIVECILNLQRDFLEQGPIYLKPLELKDVARILGIHKSTVSRAISGKYIQTPQGLFRLRDFFDGGIKDNNHCYAQRGIKEIMKELISNEQGQNYLSDSKIAKILRSKGINIARRTVAKYREQLRILPSYLRRR